MKKIITLVMFTCFLLVNNFSYSQCIGDSANSTVYTTPFPNWTTGTGAISGLGKWTLTNTTKGVFFNGTSTDNDNGGNYTNINSISSNTAWGFNDENGGIIEATRNITSGLSVGETLKFSIDNGAVKNSASNSIGFSLRDQSSQIMMEIYLKGGQPYYTINDATNSTDGNSNIPPTLGGLDISISFTTIKTYDLYITVKNTKTTYPFKNRQLFYQVGGSPTNLRFFNNSGGNTTNNNFYVNNISVSVLSKLSSNSPVCAGTTLNLLDSTGNGAIFFSWIGPNGFTSFTNNPTINNVTTAASGIYKSTATINGCSSDTQKINIVINALPTPSFTTQPSSDVCVGNNVTYTTQSGQTNYIWTVPGVLNTDYKIISGGLGATSNTVTLQFLTANSITVSINYTNSNGCTAVSATNSGTIAVNALPSPTFIAQAGAAICASNDVTYTTQAGQSNYVWTVPGILNTDYKITGGGLGASSNTVTLQWLTSGNKTVSINYNNSNSCSALSATNTTQTTVSALPSPSFTAQAGAAACASNNVTYTTQTGQSNYVWTVPGILNTDYKITGGGLGATSNTVTLQWLTSGNKTISINYTNSNSCTALSATNSTQTTVSALPSPTFIAQAGSAVCASNDVTYTTQAGQSNYVWTVPGILNTDYKITGGGLGASSNTVTLQWLTSGNKTVSINYYNSNSCTALSATNSTQTTVSALPTPTFTAQPASSVCASNISTFNNIIYTTQAGQSNYIWTVPGALNTDYIITGGGIGIGSNTVTLQWLTTGNKTVSINYTNSNSCTALNTTSSITKVNPLPTATIAGNTTVCKNSATSITFTGATGTAPYTFSYNINGGITQTVTSVSGNSYQLPAITSNTGSVPYNLLSVQDASSTTCSQPQISTVTVVINPLPTASIGGTNTVCQSSTAPNVTFTGGNATAPYTFTYTINGTNKTVTTTSGNSVTVAAPTGNAGNFNYNLVSVMESSTTFCSQNQSGTAIVVVNPLPTATISGTTTVCQNDNNPNITFTGSSATAPYTFTYTIGGVTNTVTTTTGNSVTVATPTATGGTVTYNLISVKESSTTFCSQNQSGVSVVTINPNPAVPTFTIAPTSVCAGTKNQNLMANCSAPTGGITWNWSSQDANSTVKIYDPSTGNNNGSVVSFGKTGNVNATIIVVDTIAATGCHSTNSISIPITGDSNPDSAVVYNYGGNLVCALNPPNTYQWGYDLKPSLDSVSLSGETYQNYSYTSLDLANKAYWVIVGTGKCVSKNYYNSPYNKPVTQPVTPIVTQESIKLYPNPVTSSVEVSWNIFNQDDIKLVVTDVFGRVVSTKTIKNAALSGNTTMDVNKYSHGVYFLTVIKGNNVSSVQKFLKN